MSRKADPRVVAVRALGDVLDDGRSLAETTAFQALRQARDQGFARHLAYGVLRWLGALEWLAGELLDRPLKRKDRDVHRLLLIGLFRLEMSSSVWIGCWDVLAFPTVPGISPVEPRLLTSEC